MTIAALLQRPAESGISLAVEGDGLPYRGPKGNLTPELRATASANKSDLGAFLSSDSAAERLAFPRDPAERFQPFSLTDFQQAYCVHFAVRLLAFNAMTLHAIYRDVIGFYENPDYAPPLGRLAFRDYVAGLDRHRAAAPYRKSLAYWRERARLLPSTSDLCRARVASASRTSRLERLSGRLSAGRWSSLREHARLAHGRPINSALCPVYTDTLARWATSRAFTINMLSANRPPVPRSTFQLIDSRVSTPQVWLDHQVMEARGELVVNWDYAIDRFPPGLVDEMFAHCRAHLEALAARPEAWQARSFELSEQHLAARRRANDTAVDRPRGTLYPLFEETERRYPDRPALLSESLSLSYRETGEFASHIGTVLRDRGVRPGDLVGVYVGKSAEQIVATLGVLHAGAADFPLDAKLPPARVRQILAHSQARALLVDDETVLQVASVDGVEVVQMPVRSAVVERESKHLAPVRVTDDAVAYVIYTSGSTGQPKGIIIDHCGAVHTIRDVNRRFDAGTEDRIFALSSLGFDLSVFDIFGALAAGVSIVVPDDDEIPNPELWIDALERFSPTIWNSVPALLEMTLDYANDDSSAWLSALRVIVLSGDWIRLPLVKQLLRCCPAARLVGLGGATEASIWASYFEIPALDPSWPSVPHGFPLANQTFTILDRDIRPTPTWVHGDLYIGGIGVAKGYLNDPEMTAASFVVHPATREHLYRTGDRGCYMPDGAIEFAGREDAQVKIRGFRAELGEIDAVLRAAPGVESAVAVVQGTEMREQRLVAFVVASELSPEELESVRVALGDKLPSYMVPSALVPLASLPLSANGKVDRGALKITVSPVCEETGARRPLETSIEIQLGALWREVLGVRDLAADDDFFTVGGSSLQALRRFHGIERTFSRRLPLSSLFRTRTIAGQALLINERADGPGAPAECSSLVTLSTDTSDREVLALTHPVGGDILCYHELSRSLPARFMVAGIRPPALDSDSGSLDSLGDAAARYVQALLARYPQVRLHLSGWSMGGVLAYECARRLRGLGHPVGSLFLVDSWLGHSSASRDELAMVAGFFTDLLGSEEVRGLISDVRHAPQAEWVLAAYDRLERSGRLPRDAGLARAARLYAVYSANIRALERYRIEPYDGPVVLFRAAGNREDAVPYLRPFAERATELVGHHRSIDLPVDYYEIMRYDAVATIARTIASALDSPSGKPSGVD